MPIALPENGRRIATSRGFASVVPSGFPFNRQTGHSPGRIR